MSAATKDRIPCQIWRAGRRDLIQRGRIGQWVAAKLILVGTFAFFLLPVSTSATPIHEKEVRRVLIFNQLDPLSSPALSAIDQAIAAALAKSPYQIELYTENLESTLFDDEASQLEFRKWYIHKYRDRKPDVIITAGPEPLKFMVESHERSFSGIPIIFCGSTEEMLGQLQLDSSFTGTWGVEQPEKTLNAALHLQPGTKHVVVVGGEGSYDRYVEAIAKESFRKYESSLDVTYVTDLDMPTLLERLKQLPSNTIVYYTSIMLDAAGKHFIGATQALPMVASAANAPVFVMEDVDVGRGSVGGDVLSYAAEGQAAGEVAVRVLNGERPQDISIIKSANIYMFDWRAMQRFGLQEKNLPAGSVVLYRQPTVWEAYRWYIVGGIFLMFVEMLLIFGLLWQRTRRRKMEIELATIYDRLRLAMEAGSAGGWDWAVKSGKNLGFGNAAGLLGLTADEYSSSAQEFWDRVHREDRGQLQDAMQKARENHTEFDEEFRVVWPDGTVHWLRSRGRYYYAANGEPERMLGISLDTTERKLAGEALSQASRRLIEAQEAERRRIGRDLHDNVGQRIALLAVELQLLQQDPPDSAAEVSRRMGELWKQTSGISTDVQVLSHELHSSRLEYMGMVPAMRSFCEEFSKQQKVEIEFKNQDLGRSFPPDVSLCLFRVLQEALHNAMKHSGVRHFKVQLRGTSDE